MFFFISRHLTKPSLRRSLNLFFWRLFSSNLFHREWSVSRANENRDRIIIATIELSWSTQGSTTSKYSRQHYLVDSSKLSEHAPAVDWRSSSDCEKIFFAVAGSQFISVWSLHLFRSFSKLIVSKNNGKVSTVARHSRFRLCSSEI